MECIKPNLGDNLYVENGSKKFDLVNWNMKKIAKIEQSK